MIPLASHSWLWCDTSSKLVCDALWPWCHIIPLIMVPINFWQNFDLLEKEHFFSSKIDKVRKFKKKYLNLGRKSLKYKTWIFGTFWFYFDNFWINLIILALKWPIWFKVSHTYRVSSKTVYTFVLWISRLPRGLEIPS